MKTINFIDLFDWEKESDIHYITMLQYKQNLNTEWEEWEEEQRKKRLPATIKFIKSKENEITINSREFSRNY